MTFKSKKLFWTCIKLLYPSTFHGKCHNGGANTRWSTELVLGRVASMELNHVAKVHWSLGILKFVGLNQYRCIQLTSISLKSKLIKKYTNYIFKSSAKDFVRIFSNIYIFYRHWRQPRPFRSQYNINQSWRKKIVSGKFNVSNIVLR